MNLNFRLFTYWRVWLMTAQNALQTAFVNRWTNALFLLGKLLRLVMTLIVLWLFKTRDLSIGDYTSDQVIVFFLTYQLIDVISQCLYRGVYKFGQLMRTGEFDFLLAKPVSPLFRSLTGEPDIDDAVFLIPVIGLTIYLFSTLDINLSWISILGYIALMINSFLIVTGLHIFTLVFGLLTMEVDNLIWTYRDLSRLGQFPITMYIEPIRLALFFLLPIGFMITIPAQFLINMPLSYNIVVASLVGVGFLLASLRAWTWSLKQYGSASS